MPHPKSTAVVISCQQCGNDFTIPRYRLANARFCDLACKKQFAIDNTENRFWSKVDQSGGPDACWPWLGYILPSGYGYIKVQMLDGAPKDVRAHRYALEVTQGPIPEGHYACHTCDNPICCNPLHLFVGTPADNTHDAQSKGRIPKKFTDGQIRDIRARHIPYKVPYAQLAREYGVATSTIRDVVKRYIAKHIE